MEDGGMATLRAGDVEGQVGAVHPCWNRVKG